MEYRMKGGMPGMPGMPQLPPTAPLIPLVIGGGLVLFGVLLFFNEWLLRWIVAGILVFVGLLLTMLGLRLKRMLG
jgi:hypothetical protein